VPQLFIRFAFYGLILLWAPVLAASEEALEYNSVGATLLEHGKTDAAVAEFQKALRLDPTYLPARLNLAYAYERAGKMEDAIAAYQEAIAAEPGNFFAHNNLGVLFDKKSQYDAAIAEFQSALHSEPGNAMALKNLQTAKKNKAAMQEREAQLQRAEKEAQAKPTDPQASYNVARLYAFYGRKELALQWLGRALKQGYKDLAYVRTDPAFTNIREDRDLELLLLKK